MNAENDSFVQCDARYPARVFSSYAFGDPMPHNALFIGEDGEVEASEAITVYVRCERESGHAGRHLARKTTGWTDAQADEFRNRLARGAEETEDAN